MLSATDMEVGLRLNVKADVDADGTALVPGRLLQEVVKALPADDVVVQREGEDLSVEAGSARFRLKLYGEEDFPRLPEVVAGEEVRVAASEFCETIERVVRSASRDEARPVLTGVFVSASGNVVVMVATDSYRLSVKETKVERALDRDFEANIPARAMQEVARIAAGMDVETLGICLSGNQVVFTLGETILSSRLIEGQFPSYKQLVPEVFEHRVVLGGDEFLGVVKRIGLMAQKNSPLKLVVGKGEITVSASTSDVGEAVENVSVRYDGEGVEVGFNPAFLQHGLEGAGGGDIELSLISPLRPGLIKRVEDDGFQYLIMPVRLNV